MLGRSEPPIHQIIQCWLDAIKDLRTDTQFW